jgi:hypothetical protein
LFENDRRILPINGILTIILLINPIIGIIKDIFHEDLG